MQKSLSFLVTLCVLLCPWAGAASREPVRAKNGMVASGSEVASRVGVDILKRGGNAVDAAVAVAFVLAVTLPTAGNIAGGGFMMIHTAEGKSEIIDYRERAPLAATRDMYLDAGGKPIEDLYENGHKAVGVPGTIAGLALAHRRYAKLPWRDLIEPARRIAESGFEITPYLEWNLADKKNFQRLSRFPESRRIFLRGDKPYRAGEMLRQPELAVTLRRIARAGPREFYEGRTAKLILDEMRAGGGLLTERDLREYEPVIRQPLEGSFRGYQILTMPPPSSGGTALIQMLNMLERYDIKSRGHNSADAIHLLVEVMRRAFADRASHLGDSDFVRVPVAGLTSKSYAAELTRTISTDQVTPSTIIRAGDPTAYEPSSTTHFSIVDADGNVVSNTYTLEDSFGSAVTVRGGGFLLNNEMGDFTMAPGQPNAYGLVQGEGNSIEPRKRPLSSMTPTIVKKDGKVLLVLGSPGGPRIINTVLQVILNVLEHGMNIQEAVDVPRIHHQWMSDEIYWEDRGVNSDTRRLLEALGHKFRKEPFAEFVGDAQVIMIHPVSGIRLGASDPRRGGAAIGY